MATVDIRDVRKAFGTTQILHGVSVGIEDGQFVVLVGPSGCGKSTLLRMLAGLENITGGEISIGGRVVNNVPPKDRDIAMVFQNYALYPHMTVFQNMAFSMKLAGAPKEVMEQEVQKAAKILGLEQLLLRFPRQLSGGQRQRVAMGRAIVRNPQVFLFDEPLSNLDAKLRVQMRSEIRELHQRLKVTTVYVTHDQIEAMTMADLIVVMNHGRIEQAGAPLELYDRPANLFVAGFIGSPAMNMLEGRIEGGVFHGAGGIAWPLPPGAPTSGDVVYGIRPEHFRLDPDRPAGHGSCRRTDGLRDAGGDAYRGGACARRFPRTRLGAGRGRPAGLAGSGAGPSVRPADRAADLKQQEREEAKMNNFTRRMALGLGGSAIAAAALRGGDAWAQAAPAIPTSPATMPRLPIEANAELRLIRPSRFVPPDEVIFRESLREIHPGDRREGHGRLRGLGGHRLSRPRSPPTPAPAPTSSLASARARTSMPTRSIELTDIAEYLGTKYGGWMFLGEKYGKKNGTNNWIGLPMGGSTGPLVYRKSAVNEAGFTRRSRRITQASCA